MRFLRSIIRALVPAPVRERIRERQRHYRFGRSMRRAMRQPLEMHRQPELLGQLVECWGNLGYSALTEYLSACLFEAGQAKGPILECGSGLSTLLLGVVAEEVGQTVWTLEHHPGWGQRVQGELNRFGIRSVRLCLAELRSRGPFTWYDPPLQEMPGDFALVVCDGPPGDTPGGRHGLAPVMRSRLRPGCVILLDDTDRPEEQEIAARWQRELPATLEIKGKEKTFGRLVVGGA